MKQHSLYKSLLQLKNSSKGAIADGLSNSLDDVKKYLHIKRKIENDLLGILQSAAQAESKQLILVCGNVGDGKSHLLSQIRINHENLLKEFKVHNDATESSRPDRSYLDELTDLLEPFSDTQFTTTGKEKIILAINLGTLSNFLAAREDSFNQLKLFVDRKEILEVGVSKTPTFDSVSSFQFVNFCDSHLFRLTPDGPISDIIVEMFERVTAESESNPINKAYKEDLQFQTEISPISFNYKLLSMKVIQEQLSQLLIQCILKQGLIISIRALYNFIHDIIVPVNYDPTYDGILPLDAILPNYIFEHPEISPIFKCLHDLDPVRRSSEKLDELIINMAVSEKSVGIFRKHFEMDTHDIIFEKALKDNEDRTKLIKTFIRMSLLNRNEMFVQDKAYQDFTRFLYHYYHGDNIEMKQLWGKLKSAIFTWNGNADDGKINIYTEHLQREYRISEELEFLPDFKLLQSHLDDYLDVFNTKIPITIKPKEGNSDIILIDYRLYDLLDSMSLGYRPCSLDKSKFLSFSRFVDRLLESGSKKDRIYFQEIENGNQFLLECDDFGDFCFRRC